MRTVALVPLAALLACNYNGSGQATEDSPDTTGTSSATTQETDAGSSTAGPDPTTAEPDLTTEPVDPSTGTTASVDPTTGGPACGDGIADVGEKCDGADLFGWTCELLDLGVGTLACAADCTFDTSGCEGPIVCGDGVKGSSEDCDGEDLGDATCVSLGYVEGALACTPRCTLDESGCSDIPADWYDTKWKKRRLLTIPKDKVTGALIDFPAALASSDAGLVGALGAGAKGIVFATPGKQKLSHEVELASGGRLVVWIELLELSDAADTQVYLYYNNPEFPETDDGAGTWSNGFLGVWHLGEYAMDEKTNANHRDSTGNNHPGKQNGNTSMGEGQLGRCQTIDDDDYIEIEGPQDFALGDADATISAWFRTTHADGRGLFHKADFTDHAMNDLLFGLDSEKIRVDQGFDAGLLGAADIADDQWHHAVWTQQKDAEGDQERWVLYIDGELDAEALITGQPAVPEHLVRIGSGTPNSDQDHHLEGPIDEVQVSTVARSPEWIATAYSNQSDPTSFFVVGAEQSL